MRWKTALQFLSLLLLLTSCETNMPIVNNVDEREANEIIVYLAQNGVTSHKVSASTGDIAGTGSANMWNIATAEEDSVRAMALLNEVGLPRRQGTNLLKLFEKTGLMSSDREETIRYHAGLAEELKNTIRKMDGVLDADVQISFPLEEPAPGEEPPKITAAVYIKQQTLAGNPNSHLESKIKRLIAGSIPKLDYNSVSVVADQAQFMGNLNATPCETSENIEKDLVKLWSITMSKSSLSRFRMIFFSLILLVLFFGVGLIWVIYMFYPKIFKKILKIKEILPKKNLK